MASPGQEQSQQEMMGQMIQMSKELNNEKTAHNKVKHQLLCCIAQLEETKSCMEQVEAASFGTIKDFLQLVYHNQNVERALAFNQQYLDEQREAQTTEIQDCKQRAVELATNIEKLEISTLTVQNRMLSAQINQLRNEKDKKISKRLRNRGKIQIERLEVHVRNSQTQLNKEKRELTAELFRCNLYLEDSCCSQEFDVKLAKVMTTELAAKNDKEKQQITAQILSSYTKIKKAMNLSHQQNEKTEELQKEFKLESEQQSSNVFEANNSEPISIQIGIVEFTEGASQPSLNKIETQTTKIQEFQEAPKAQKQAKNAFLVFLGCF